MFLKDQDVIIVIIRIFREELSQQSKDSYSGYEKGDILPSSRSYNGKDFYKLVHRLWCIRAYVQLPIRKEFIQSTRQVANNESVSVEAIGSTHIEVIANDKKGNKLTDVLYVPKLNANLLSVSRIIQKGHSITFDNRGCRILNAKKKVVATAKLTSNGMYKLNQSSAEAKSASIINTSNQWHKRFRSFAL